jgi:hypothetical protein
MSDYLKASVDAPPRAPLTPNSTANDAAGVVEIVKLVGDPVLCKKRLDELQAAAAHADLRLAAATAKEAELAKQVEDLARLRQEHTAALEVDRANHIGRRLEQEQAMKRKLAEAEEFFATLKIGSDPQPEEATR